MAYIDEPNVIREGGGRKKFILAGIGVVLFLLLVFSAFMEPWYREFQRHRTPEGPHGGDLYTITLENRRVGMELARLEPENRLMVFLRPAADDPEWNPADYRIGFRVGHMTEPHFLEWNEDGTILATGEDLLDFDPLDPRPAPFSSVRRFYGPSEFSFPPAGDFHLELEIHRGGEVVWEGKRWSYGPEAHDHDGHGHGHGHSH